MKHISLFTGIGGFDLAAEWMGWENVAHCEIDPFCRRLLNYYWPKSKSHEDIKTTDFTIYRGNCYILTGGFPCQPFSVAGLRNGTDDDRYLWDEYLRAIREAQPACVVAENVTGILSMEEREMFFKVDSRKRIRFDYIDEYEAVYTRQAKMLLNTICEDLEKEGYTVQPIIIPAAGVNAPHRRERIWIVAYSSEKGYSFRRNVNRVDRSQKSARKKSKEERKRVRNVTWGNDDSEITPQSNELNGNLSGFCSGNVPQFKETEILGSIDPNANSTRREELNNPDFSEKSGFNNRFYKSEPRNWDNFPTQPPVCDGNDGVSSRLDGITFSNWRNESIRAGGNAIVPQVALEIYKAIDQYIKENETP